MSLVEVLVATAIMAIVSVGVMSFFEHLIKSNNYAEFLAKRTQLRLALVGQFLNNPDNCKCLFAGASTFPAAGTATLAGVAPTTVGPYLFGTPGDCTTATIPNPFATAPPGVDGLIAQSISLTDIAPVAGGQYKGKFNISITSTKVMSGLQQLNLSIPVAVSTVPAGANRQFGSCSMLSVTTTSKQGFCTSSMAWDNADAYVCPVLLGYTAQKASGAYQGAGPWYRTTSCCYIPDEPGSNGWCSPGLQSWNASWDSCGAGTTNYTAITLRGRNAGVYDQSQCCFVPLNPPNNPREFSSQSFASDSAWSNCPNTFPLYDVLDMTVLTGGAGSNSTCTYVPK